jgi:hypothetical protein
MADADVVDTAVDLGADIEARDGQGRTPLLAAAMTANTETFTRLLHRGADVTACDAEGQSVDDLLDSSTGAGEIRHYLEELRSRPGESNGRSVGSRSCHEVDFDPSTTKAQGTGSAG